MGWEIGEHNGRDIGYGVPATCDHPKCDKEIDRGLGYVCGGQPYGGEHGCGLFFCDEHLYFHSFRYGETAMVCKRCDTYKPSYDPKPDILVWLDWKLKDKSWAEWRKNHKEEVKEYKKRFDK